MARAAHPPCTASFLKDGCLISRPWVRGISGSLGQLGRSVESIEEIRMPLYTVVTQDGTPPDRTEAKIAEEIPCVHSAVMKVPPLRFHAAPDRAPEQLAGGTAAALRDDLIALLGPAAVRSRGTELIKYATDASPCQLFPQLLIVAESAASRPLKTQCQHLNSCEDFVTCQGSGVQEEPRKTCFLNIQSFGVPSAY